MGLVRVSLLNRPKIVSTACCLVSFVQRRAGRLVAFFFESALRKSTLLAARRWVVALLLAFSATGKTVSGNQRLYWNWTGGLQEHEKGGRELYFCSSRYELRTVENSEQLVSITSL